MNFNFTKNIVSILALSFFLILAIGSEDDESGSSSDKEESTTTEAVEPSQYAGTHRGSWEGFIINQYNSGSARLNISDDNSATLELSGSMNATHTGYVKGNNFISTSANPAQTCSIVDMGGGKFKIVMIWQGVNLDVNF